MMMRGLRNVPTKEMRIYDLIASRNEGIYEGVMIVEYRIISRDNIKYR